MEIFTRVRGVIKPSVKPKSEKWKFIHNVKSRNGTYFYFFDKMKMNRK